jgi:hypothetical protein
MQASQYSPQDSRYRSYWECRLRLALVPEHFLALVRS